MHPNGRYSAHLQVALESRLDVPKLPLQILHLLNILRPTQEMIAWYRLPLLDAIETSIIVRRE
jgi:hypothetical protein